MILYYYRYLLVILLNTLSITVTKAQIIDNEKIYCSLVKTVSYLSNDSLKGREAGSKYDIISAEYIISEFKKIHTKPYFEKEYIQKFVFKKDSVRTLNSQNVAAFISPKKNKHTIIIGAHYDHIGMGGKLSKSFLQYEPHNGADDNASGVAVVMELARLFNASKLKNYKIIFTAFSAHEDGLFGSKFFANSIIMDTNCTLMINIDMVGRLDTSSKNLYYYTNFSLYDSLIHNQTDKYLVLKPKLIENGDHTAFMNFNIPVISFTTGLHDDYHKTTDDAEYINYDGLTRITRYIFSLINNLE